MKNIHIVYTDKRNILAIAKPTGIALLLKANEHIVQNWYYDQPRELESFLKAYPDKENDILKAFSYWVINKVTGVVEEQNRYGTLKRELKAFSEHLFKVLRAIAGRIALQIKKFIKKNSIH